MNLPKKLIIFGDGEIAELANFYFKHDSNFEVCAFTVDAAYLNQSHFNGLPVVPFEELTREFSPQEYSFFAALSYSRMNAVRTMKYQAAKALGYPIASYVSSKASVWPGFKTGENCFIFEDNTIQPFVQLGNNITLWSGNHIGHHSKIHDNCFISSHVVVSGGVTIFENCFIGVNATLRDHITIAHDCIIAAGALVVKDTQPQGIYAGHPAKLMKMIDENTQI